MTRAMDRLDALATMTLPQLRTEWLRVYRTPTPAIGKRLLALAIAHRLQEKTMGRLAGEYARELSRLAAKLEKHGTLEVDAAAKLKVGSRLVRDWHGTPHQVLIRDGGFVYRDRVYGSLSQIAQEITGAKWSGPRFFGLKSPRLRTATHA